MIKGRITSNIAGSYKVNANGIIYSCSLRGSLKFSRNITVGDFVMIDEEAGVIVSAEQPKNSMIRPKVSNIDIAFVVTSIDEPPFSKYLVLKFITYFRFQNIEPVIVFTKSDLDKNSEELQTFLNELEKSNVKYYVTSIHKEDDIPEIKDFCLGKTVLFCGQTGAGKSSLINKIEPNFERLIGNYSFALNRGKHQTKENILLPLNDETYLVDTPGFSSLDLKMSKIAVRDNFPLISEHINKCKFANCLHINEPECQVKKLVEIEEIPLDWYNIYKELINDVLE